MKINEIILQFLKYIHFLEYILILEFASRLSRG